MRRNAAQNFRRSLNFAHDVAPPLWRVCSLLLRLFVVPQRSVPHELYLRPVYSESLPTLSLSAM